MELAEVTTVGAGLAQEARDTDSAKLFADDAMTFINLFLTQLQNQDPLEPQDASQMLQQISQLAQVEEAHAQGDQLDKLIELNQQTGNSDLISMVGKRVEVQGDNVRLNETGNVRVAYELEQDYANAFVTIADPNTGTTIFSGDAIKTAGKNSLEWDGTDNSGNRVPAGDYYVRVDVSTENQESLFKVPTYVLGDVEGVAIDNENGSTVTVNGADIALSDIKYVAAGSGSAANNNETIN